MPANRISLDEAHMLAHMWRLPDYTVYAVPARDLPVMKSLRQKNLVRPVLSHAWRITTLGWIEIYDLNMRHIDLEADAEKRAW